MRSFKESRDLRGLKKTILRLARYGEFNTNIGQGEAVRYHNIGLRFLHEEVVRSRRRMWIAVSVIYLLVLVVMHQFGILWLFVPPLFFLTMLGLVGIWTVIMERSPSDLAMKNDEFSGRLKELLDQVDAWAPIGENARAHLKTSARSALAFKAKSALMAIATKKVQEEKGGHQTEAAELNVVLTKLWKGLANLGVDGVLKSPQAYYDDVGK